MSSDTPVPPPPEGYASWLDYATEGPLSFAIHARAELAALRKELAETRDRLCEEEDELASARADHEEDVSELAALRKELATTQGLLATAQQNLVEVDAQRAEAVREMEEAWKVADQCRQDRADVLTVHAKEGMLASEWVMRTATAERERDALRAQVAEMREAVIGLDNLTSVGGGKLAMGALTCAADVQRFNDLVAKLIGESAPKEEKQP